MPDESTYAYRCPFCGHETIVDRAVRGALLEHGCVVCGAPVTTTAFA